MNACMELDVACMEFDGASIDLDEGLHGTRWSCPWNSTRTCVALDA
jgi:hypothetical protein